MKKIYKNNKFNMLTEEEQLNIVGGGHCYTKSCLAGRDKSIYNGVSFTMGFGYGVCQSVGICN
ncbi:hypothetical protein [Companilactobacillus formosensis]|jgi:hypothetical protein|uniref:hypothetical protein n=1 Tax=Companilactobacillus formosensis TaxID=1617889 RepID=UPI000E65C617|nr:hypothetical protein [Companilactobacillus formosensis]